MAKISESGLLIAGCGYVGREVAHACHRDPDCVHTSIVGTTRSSAGSEALGKLSVRTLLLDLDAGGRLPARSAPWSLLYLVPPPRHGLHDTRLSAFLSGLRGPLPQRIVYMSTSGVYGDRAGARISEQDMPAPATDRARRRLDAENQVRGWCGKRGVDWVILRVPGIYGPGRLSLDRIRDGKPILREADCGPGNRIHRDDLARCCRAALTTRHSNQIFNVCDDDPASSCAFALEVAQQAGLPAPPQVSLDQARETMGALRLSFLAESRRLENRRMHTELAVRLDYPDMSSGIAASLAASVAGN